MKMPSIPLAQAKAKFGQYRDWLASRAAPIVIEIPSKAEKIGFALGRKTRSVMLALRT